MKNLWLRECKGFCSWPHTQWGVEDTARSLHSQSLYSVPQQPQWLYSVLSKDFVDGEVCLRACQVAWLLLYLVCGYPVNQLSHPLVWKSPTCTDRPTTCLVPESGFRAFPVCTLISSSVPGIYKAPCRCARLRRCAEWRPWNVARA